MSSFTDFVTDIFGGDTAEDKARKKKRHAERVYEAQATEIQRQGPPSTEMTGGLSDQRNKDREKRRRRLSMMTGGLGSANTSRLRLGA